MSARGFRRHAALLCLFSKSGGGTVHRVQHLCSERTHGHVQEEEKGPTVQQPQKSEPSQRSLLVYNPSAYYQPRETVQRKEDTSGPVPSAGFNFAFRRDVAKNGSKYDPLKDDVSAPIRKHVCAFQGCRPEYSVMTYGMSQCPPAIQIKDALSLLHKTTLMKNTDASNIAHVFTELGRVDPEQTVAVRGHVWFSVLLRYSVENMENFTHLELIEVLRAFVRLRFSHHHSILELFEAEFCRRADGMELHQLLLVADLWRCLGRSVPQYVYRLCESISRHFNQMGPPELVQFVYILGESRQCPAFVLECLEGIMMRHLEELKGEEVGAVCLGLFKTQNSFSEGALRRLVDRACVVVKEISDFGIVSVMKLMRFSHLDHLHWLETLSSEVPRRAPQMAVQGLMHIALTCSALHYRNDRVLLAVAENLPHSPSQYRSKDAAKLLWAFGNLGFLPSQCPSLHPRLTEALRDRKSEFRSYPEHLLTALLGLAFVNQFPRDLLTFALSPEFTSRVSGLIDLKKDLFTLDGTVAIELPDWTGPRVNPSIRTEVTKQLWDFAQSELCQKPEVLEAEAVLQGLFGGKVYVHKRMILPHLRSVDLEVHLDPSGNPLPVAAESYQSQNHADEKSSWPSKWKVKHGVTLNDDLLLQLTGGIKTDTLPCLSSQQPILRPVEASTRSESILSVGVDLTADLMHAITKQKEQCAASSQAASASAVTRLAIQVTSRNQYCYRTQRLTGLNSMKRRQLALAGYTVVEVSHWEWFPLLRRSLSERLAYMHCKIFSSFDSRNRKQ
ncbi:FAST kinase domain-containing protein 5, mitochondrial [Bagarius yarrelli]|uniref:FAST kinase domain-containing protein 5, mitochondrial n=1 Tax=Bagarius yarrelli TaxID=175774 RepID=A0A556TYM0_BAGYA|nr:FAST kinase domain-containing protein 5, mitochondrial [Bagarius yarrelli]